MKLILAILCTICLMTVNLPGSTGYIEGVIVSIEDGNFVIKGLNHYNKKESEAKEHKIPGKGKPVYILNGHISTRAATLKAGRKCFVFWNRHQTRMVVAITGPEETNVSIQPGPTPGGECVNTTQGYIKSDAPGAIVFTVTKDGQESEKRVPITKKAGFIRDTTFGSPRGEVCAVGQHAVAFCYRNREYPNFVVSYSGATEAATTPTASKE